MSAGSMRAALLVIGLLFISSQSVSAYSVSPITVDPTGALLQCAPVNATFVISNPTSDTNDYPGAEDIELSTELDRPVWSLILLIDGEQKLFLDQKNSHVLLSNWNLTDFNRNTSHEQIRINLAGTVPRVPQTSNKTIVRILQISADNNPVAGSVRSAVTVVVNCCMDIECNYLIPLDEGLQQFRTDIDRNATMGIDTTAAEAKYSEAEQKIASARALPSTHYVQKFSNLNTAKEAIADGEQALDRASAEKEVADAQELITKPDAIIAQFPIGGRPSDLQNSAGFLAMISNREIAVQYLSTANDQIAAGNYSAAHESIGIALALGNQSYASGLEYQKLKFQPTPVVPLSPVCSVFALVIAGFVVACFSGKSMEDTE
jgi:hypothetical protein